MCRNVHVCLHTCVFFANVYTYAYSAYIHTYIHTYVHMYIRVYVHTYVHTYVHIYIHAYIRTLLATIRTQTVPGSFSTVCSVPLQQEDELLGIVVHMHQLLESCNFKDFWVRSCFCSYIDIHGFVTCDVEGLCGECLIV